jgi:hypothetical protein
MPGAFEKTIARNPQVPMLFNHFMDNLIGRAVDLKENDIGLQFSGRLTPGASMADDIYQHMKAQALDGVSIGYRVQPGGAEMDGKIRKLTAIDLMEISMVIAPANKLARADLASLKSDFDPDDMESLADVETFLRDAGMSRVEAKSFIARVRDIALRDAGKADTSHLAAKTDLEEAAVLATFIRSIKTAV